MPDPTVSPARFVVRTSPGHLLSAHTEPDGYPCETSDPSEALAFDTYDAAEEAACRVEEAFDPETACVQILLSVDGTDYDVTERESL